MSYIYIYIYDKVLLGKADAVFEGGVRGCVGVCGCMGVGG